MCYNNLHNTAKEECTMAMDYSINYRGIRLKLMGLNHIKQFVSLFHYSKEKSDAIAKEWEEKLARDAEDDVINNFIIIHNDTIIGVVRLSYLESIINGAAFYSDANMMIHLPCKKHHHLTTEIVLAMINLCKNTYIVDSLGIPSRNNGEWDWTTVQIVPESAEKTA